SMVFHSVRTHALNLRSIFLIRRRLRGRVVVVLAPAKLEQVAIRMIHPVGRRHLHRSLPFRLLYRPLLNVELDVA
uniref:Uncharacterized protein n=1 Tax=Anopheles atroparvus TaxID=41427 RepID=A0AAG5DN76_ANOAO